MIGVPFFLRKFLFRCAVGKRSPAPAKASIHLKACLFKLDGFGDFVLALGAIREVMQHFGEEQCALVIYSPLVELARREFPKATIIGWSRFDGNPRHALTSYFREAKLLKNYQFEILICLRYQRTLFQQVVLSWINAKHSIGFLNLWDSAADRRIFQFEFTETLSPANEPGKLCGEMERHQAILNRVLGTGIPDERILPHFNSLTARTGEALLVTPISRLAIKDYPFHSLIAALKDLQAATKIPIVLAGGPGDAMELKTLQDNAGKHGVNARVQISHSIQEFAQAIAEAGAVLTVDTASAHFATALDKPTVVIFGGWHYGHFGPWHRSSKQIWLSNVVPCFNCGWKCIHPKAICITEIPPQRIAAAVVKVINES